MSYKVNFGSGVIIKGSFSGEVGFLFDKNGINFLLHNIEKKINKKDIKKISFQKNIKDEIVKGDALAKFKLYNYGAGLASNKSISSEEKIAQVQINKARAEDRVQKKEIDTILLTLNNNDELLIAIDSGKLQSDIELAFHNPKKFFQNSVEAQTMDIKPKNKKSNLFWWIWWAVGLFIISAPVQDLSNLTEEQFNESSVKFIILLVFIFILISYPLYSKFKSNRDINNQSNKFKNSKEYEEILNNL